MTHHVKSSEQEDDVISQQYYLDIINCMPNIVYWVDMDCRLKGCNINYVKLLGLERMQDFNGTPYEQMAQHLPWPAARIEALKLDDMSVIFSGVAQYDVEEAPFYYEKKEEKEVIYYRSTRVPLFNEDKYIMGLVVILTNITAHKAMEQLLHLAQPAANAVQTDASLGRTLRVLVVEDNLIAQNVERAMLTALNCEVDVAESGEAAFKLFVPGQYDLVFMDIGLQDTSGYVVSKTFREKEKGTGHYVPIIALTSYKADVVKFDCKDYFMDGVVTKPLTSDEAKKIIQHYVYHDGTPSAAEY